ncbi:MAG: hypothetical protein Q9220_007024 [cf. Caloplaca sp. 1 TL-2023]
MTTSLGKGLTRSTSKRARSTDSSRSGASTPAPKALKTQDDAVTGGDVSVPAFLRQSASEIKNKFQDLEQRQLLRVCEGRRDPNSRWAQDHSKQTRLRNRYLNVQPWEVSRIRLQVPAGDSDYINASPISLTDPRTGAVLSYIATQGPKQTGLSQFWHMIWQQTSDVAVIVMLTPTVEQDREKCFQYFPLDEQTDEMPLEPLETIESASPGTVRLSEKYFHETSKSTVRKLSLSFGKQSKVVWHLLFSGWPDFGVPQDEDRAALFKLLRISVEKNTTVSNRRIVHCSAGVGRSGSFIALEYLLAQIESGAIAEIEEDEDPIYDTVNQLREQRMTMVQSEVQYAFLYEVVRQEFIKAQSTKKLSGVQKLASGIAAALLGEIHEDQKKERDFDEGANGHIKQAGKCTGKVPDTS